MTKSEKVGLSTFLSCMTSYVTSSENLVPAPSGSPRLLRIENSLIERVVGQEHSHVFNINNIISLNLLGGKFKNINLIFGHLAGENDTNHAAESTLNAKSHLLSFLSINRILETEIFPVDNETYIDELSEAARSRVRLHFKNMSEESDFGLEAKWSCPSSILSPIILASITNIDMIGTLLADEIKCILNIFKTMGAGQPQNGPFPPIVLLQPKTGNEERFYI